MTYVLVLAELAIAIHITLFSEIALLEANVEIGTAISADRQPIVVCRCRGSWSSGRYGGEGGRSVAGHDAA